VITGIFNQRSENQDHLFSIRGCLPTRLPSTLAERRKSTANGKNRQSTNRRKRDNMSGQPAARIGDMIVCPVPQATPAALPHAPPPGLPISSPGCPTVLIGGQPAARIGDQSMCVAPAPTPNPVMRGAFPVRIGGSPAARLTDSGTHPGSMISPPCCPTVLIGLAGISGNIWAGQAACAAAAQGRTSGSTQQSYQNCGVESSRQIINQAKGKNISEDTLLNNAMGKGWADKMAIRADSGGTSSAGRNSILASEGVPSSLQPQTMANIQGAVAEGRGVITAHNAGKLWGTTQSGGHAVVVTGIEYDSDGNPTRVFINDTGSGQCMNAIPASQFQNSLLPGKKINVTSNPIW